MPRYSYSTPVMPPMFFIPEQPRFALPCGGQLALANTLGRVFLERLATAARDPVSRLGEDDSARKEETGEVLKEEPPPPAAAWEASQGVLPSPHPPQRTGRDRVAST
jgi:hypothetical protein